jgi:hypothetical protein
MFTNPKYIMDDSNFLNDGETYDNKRAIDIDLIGTLEEVVLPMDGVGVFNELEISNVLLEGALM